METRGQHGYCCLSFPTWSPLYIYLFWVCRGGNWGNIYLPWHTEGEQRTILGSHFLLCEIHYQSPDTFFFLCLWSAKTWATLFNCRLLAMMFCLTMRPNQCCQATMDCWNWESKYIFSSLNWFLRDSVRVTFRTLTLRNEEKVALYLLVINLTRVCKWAVLWGAKKT